jgi:hypothetical protein
VIYRAMSMEHLYQLMEGFCPPSGAGVGPKDLLPSAI